MVDIGKFVHSKSGKTIMSILLGFGLATLFRSVCKNKECIVFSAPPLEDINGKTYKFDNKCYKYVPIQTKCNSNKKIIPF
jgi:hypothetical protein